MKKSLSILIPVFVALPLIAQEQVAQVEAPLQEIVAVEPAEPAVSLEQFEALKADDQKQNVVLSGLSEQINSQRMLLEDSKVALQEQGVLYEQNNKRLAELTKQLNDALLTTSQLKEMVRSYNSNLATSGEESAQKAAKLEALVKKINLMEQGSQSQMKLLASFQQEVKILQDVDSSINEEIVSLKAKLDDLSNATVAMLGELTALRELSEAQIKLRDEQSARLALEIAQLKVDLADYKGKQAAESEKLVTNMAAGMVLLFLCVVVISFIFRMHVRRLKTGVLAGVNAKLVEASQEIRQMVNQPSKSASKGKSRSQR